MGRKLDSKDVGLSVGLVLGRYFLGTDDLHYGYWTDDLPVGFQNFVKAQEKHSELLIDSIPEGTKTILDVGCGAGLLAKRLIGRGYTVECVSPTSELTKRAKVNLGGKAPIHEVRFEDLRLNRTFDLVMFSESFQYVNLEQSLDLIVKFLKPGGHLLICDFFKNDVEGKSPIGGGHRLSKFYQAIKQVPLSEVKNIDITAQTAPNIELLGRVYDNVGMPIKDILSEYFSTNYPFLTKLLAWKFRRRFAKINQKYFTGVINGKAFSKFKSYRLLVYRKK